MDRMALTIGEDLYLNMPGILQEFFHVDRAVAKGSCRLGFSNADGVNESTFFFNNAHAASTATRGRFNNNGITNSVGNLTQ